MTTTAAIYARISSDPEGRALGVERQEQDCRDLAARLGFDVVRVFLENDTSASTRSAKARPLYAEMLAGAEAGRYGALVAYSNSRLTRRPREFEDLLALVERRGVRIVTVVSGEDDLATADGRMVARIKASVDAAEAERTAERVARAKAQAAQAGRFRGGRRPFGYEANGVTVREVEAEALRRAAGGLLAGRSLNALAREMAEAGVTTTGGTSMDAVALRRILQRPRNAGLIEVRGEVTGAAQWPAILTEDTWRAVVVLLGDPTRRTSTGSTRRWLGSGLYTCGVCGTPLKCSSSHRQRTYVCPEAKHVTRAQEPVDAYVQEAVCALLSRPDAADLLSEDGEGDLGALRAEAAALRTRLEGFGVDYADGLITGQMLRTSTDRVQERLSVIERDIAARVSRDARTDLLTARDPAQAFRDAPLDVRREVVRTLAEVTIEPGRKGRPAGWRPGQPYVDLSTVQVTWRW